MENFSDIVSQLESAKLNIAEVARKLKLQILELEINAARYDFIAREHPNQFVQKRNVALRDQILVYYHRMMAHELRLVKESDELRFENICRNAQMQMEGLFTYFYNFHFNDNVKQFVDSYNLHISEINKLPGRGFSQIQRDQWWKVTFADKYTLFQKFTDDADLTNYLKLLAKYRNSISHVGYVKKSEGSSPESEAVLFAKNADVNAVLYALEKLSEYVEFNTLKVSAQAPMNSQAQDTIQNAPSSTTSAQALTSSHPVIIAETTREFKGLLSIPASGEGYGFADNVFIPASIIKQHGLQTGELIQGTAKSSFNEKKNCDTWKALSAKQFQDSAKG